jgi:hypothetical protein
LKWEEEYDDYSDAPSDEVLLHLKLHGHGWEPTLAYILDHVFITPSPWSTFQDYGYRLGSDFAQAFNLDRPVKVEEHICPVGLVKPPRSYMDYTQRLEM